MSRKDIQFAAVCIAAAALVVVAAYIVRPRAEPAERAVRTRPDTLPPCYRVIFNGVMHCNGTPHRYLKNNKTWRLKYYRYDEGDGKYLWCGHDPNYPKKCLVWLRAQGGTIHVYDDRAESFKCKGLRPGDVNVSNEWSKQDCIRYTQGYDGTVTYEPVWDCNWCDGCQGLTVAVDN